MAKQKKYAKSPLLYIHQPGISHPKAPMQSNYATPKNKKPAEPQKQKVTTRPLKRDDFFTKAPIESEENESAEADLESSDNVEEQETSTSDKKFNDMTIQDKIDYFLSRPKHIPRMKCEVKTEERSFRGTIQDMEEDNILMRVGRRTSTTKIAIESKIGRAHV